MYKKQQNYFLIFWARRGLILTPTYLHVNGESGLHSSFRKNLFGKLFENDLICFIILKIFLFKF